MKDLTVHAAEVTFAGGSPAVLFDQPQLMITLNVTCGVPALSGKRLVFRPLSRFEHSGRVFDLFRHSQGHMVLAVDGDFMQFVLRVEPPPAP